MTHRTPFDKAQTIAKWTVAIGCLISLMRAALALSLPFQLNYAEGPLLGVAVGITRGFGAYPPSTALPYAINPYGPLPYYLLATVVKVFGIGFFVPRALVIVAAISSALLVALLVRHWTGSLSSGFLFGALYLTVPTVQEWLSVLRVDMFALALTLMGLYIFAASKRWDLSVVFFVAALFCKFSFVSAPLACLLFLVIGEEYRKAIRFAAACVILASAVFLMFQQSSAGWFAFHTIWSTLGHSFNRRLAAVSLLWELLDNFILLFLVAVLLIFGFRNLPRKKTLLLPLIYFCLASLTLVTRGKEGADSNYYLEWDAALCLMGGFGYGVIAEKLRDSNAIMVIAPALIACVILSNVGLVEMYRPAHNTGSDQTAAGCRGAYQFVRLTPDSRILAENIGAAVLNGRSPLIAEPFLWTRQVVDANWSDAEVLELISEEKLGLIVLGSEAAQSKNAYPNRWPRAVLSAIDQDYRLVQVFNCPDATYMYKPRASSGLGASDRVAAIASAR